MRYHLTLVRTAITKKSTNNKCWKVKVKSLKGVGKKEPSALLVGMKTGTATMENSREVLKNLKLYDPAIPLLGIYPDKAIIQIHTHTHTHTYNGIFSSQFSSAAQSCPTLCGPMDCSTPGFPVHHQLPELAQIHVHWVSDAIQPSHPLLSPSPPAFNLSQH